MKNVIFGAANRMMRADLAVSEFGGEARILNYQMVGKAEGNLPASISTPAFVLYFPDKAKATEVKLIEKGTVKLNIWIADFHQFIFGPIQEEASARANAMTLPEQESMATIMCQMLQMQKFQLEQQQKLLNTVSLLMRGGNRSHELIKPDPFDGTSSPSAWLDLYEYACSQNQWTSS